MTRHSADAQQQLNDLHTEIAVFQVAHMVCGLNIAEVQEINKDLDVTKVYQAPDYVAGIINLRGQIVSIIDLAARLGLQKQQFNTSGRNVIVNAGGERIGLIVDEIDDIISVENRQILPRPPNIDGQLRNFVRGVVQRGSDLVLILDVEALTRVDKNNMAQGAGAMHA